ncbi:hypothetical protein T11_2582 [Trichinella zimbabwensis]|uniref:Uncharacterized protein n=1 Tax=Trichinella zimbabwensis TaxID=268475 RepID=A0A0V1HXZ8_9BILA|nr:hypothetical protein T11_2582 [Trichinella zimbabwensis]
MYALRALKVPRDKKLHLGFREHKTVENCWCKPINMTLYRRREVEQLLTIDDTALFGTLIEKDENKEVDVSDKPNEGPCLKVSFNWLEQQKEFSATQLMLMRHIRDVAAQKKLSSFKPKITEYDTNQT